jgi:urease gamma subunit
MSDTTTVTTRPVVSSVNDEILPGGCIVRGMVPNPASSMSTIAITVPAPVRATIHVTDVTGKTVATLVDADVMPGMHEFMLDASGLSNGTYLVTTILGNERTSQTISIVK